MSVCRFCKRKHYHISCILAVFPKLKSSKSENLSLQLILAIWNSFPAIWNPLPKTVLSSNSVTVFESRLTTFLFSRAFSFSSFQFTLTGLNASEVATVCNEYINVYCDYAIVCTAYRCSILFLKCGVVSPSITKCILQKWLDRLRYCLASGLWYALVTMY